MLRYARIALSSGLLFLVMPDVSRAQLTSAPIIGQNVNMVAGIGRTRNADGTYSFALGDGDPFLTKQNEPSIAVSSLNPLHLMGAANDYRLIPLAQSVVVPGEGAGADSWIGLFKSTDGGRSWRSTVLGGCPVAIPQCAGNTALQGLNFASDPTVRPGPYGTFFLSFIAGNRTSSASGVVGIQRFFDLNNNVAVDDNPFRADVLNVVDSGTTGQFLDKTWNIADVPRSWNAGSTCALPTSPTPVPAFNVYISYSNFVGQSSSNPHPQIFVATSTNCGATFSKPVKVSQSVATNQGTVLTVDPGTGTVYLFWRQINTPANGSPDAIYFVKSTDSGNTWSSPSVVALINPFEQDLGTTTFRAENFPTAAVDGSGRVYVAWSQWGVGPVAPGATTGAGRIVITTSNNRGATWTTPVPVDNNFQNQTVPYAPGTNAPNGAPSWSTYNPYNAAGYGHQLQPSLSFAGGKLSLIWLDQRLDHTAARMDCSQVASSTTGYNFSQCTEVRDQRPSTGTDPVASVFTDTISDAGLAYRHTVDVFGGQALPADNPVFSVTRISQYPFGSQGGGPRTTKTIRQLQANPPDLPLFANGTTPFLGDYLDIAAQVIMPAANGSYAWNTSSSNTVFHAAWTDNRDVVPPADGVSWASYQPIMTLASDGVSVIVNPSCLPGYAGAQNQNVYTAALFGGIDAYALVNSKQLSGSAPRQFSLVVRNNTTRTQTVSLAIANQPAGGSASFSLDSALTSISPLSIYPASAITRAVWVRSSNPGATVTVNVKDAFGNLIASVPFNPDSRATVATTPPPPPGGDTVNVNQGNTAVVNTSLSNVALTSVDVGNVDPTAADLAANSLSTMDLANMDLANMDLANMDLANMDLANMDLANMDLANMDLANMDLANTTVAASAPTNMDLANAGIVDTNFLVFNNSATTDVTMDVKTLIRGDQIPPGYKAQLFVHKLYFTQTVQGGNSCSFAKVPQKVPIVNAPGPTVTPTMDLANPSITDTWITTADPSNATVSLQPHEIGYVTYRLVGNPTTNQNQNQSSAFELGSNGVKAVDLSQTTTVVPIPLVIATLMLPDATAGASTSDTLLSNGGLAPITWSQVPNGASTICPANSQPGLPPGMSLSPGGVLSGMPTTPGLYCFVVRANDSTVAPSTETDQQTLTLTVHGMQTVAFPSGALVYGSSLALPALSSAGLPITYSPSGGCSVSGSTVTATAGSGICAVTATNSGNGIYLPLSVSQQFALSPAALTVTAVNASMTYGGPLPPFTATFAGLIPGDTAASLGTVTYTTTATSSSPVGQYPVTPGGLNSSNYSITYAAGTLTIAAAKLTVTANSLNMNYGGTVPALTAAYSGFVNGDTAAVLSGTPSLSTSATSASPVGPYPITVTAGTLSATNYTFIFVNGTLTVGKGTLTVTANNLAMTYGGAVPTLTASYSGFVNGDTASTALSGNPALSTAATSSSNSGGYPVVVTAGTLSAANYTFSFVNGALTVQPAPLTVTTLAASKVYGDPLPVFGAVYTGFVLGQNASVLGGTLVFSTAATATSPVGAYPVLPGGLTSMNYAISFAPGTLTVTKATPSFSNLSSPTIVAGSTPTTMGGTIGYAGLFPSGSASITVSNSSASASISLANGSFSASVATGGLVMGTYTISYSYAGDANFLPASGTGILHVGGWVTTGSMNTARSFFAAAVLASGKVLVAGGLDSSGKSLSSAEVYDPSTGTFTYTANNMPNKGSNFTATLLPNGKVLLTGGGNASTQLYDPATNSFSSSGGMSSQRSNYTATLLNNGLVLIAGGSNNSGATQSSAQLYNPVTGTFTTTGSMAVARDFHTATLLPNGTVLIAGGRTGSAGKYTYLASAEVYDPTSGTFSSAGNMTSARYAHTAATVNGMVLIAGGGNAGALATAELYDPSQGTFTATASMAAPRQYATATAVGGTVVEAGGSNGSTSLASVEEYQGGAFVPAGNMKDSRSGHIAVLLGNDSVLVAGGVGSAGVSISTAELLRVP